MSDVSIESNAGMSGAMSVRTEAIGGSVKRVKDGSVVAGSRKRINRLRLFGVVRRLLFPAQELRRCNKILERSLKDD
jgi:hypothetical protein